MAHTIGTIFFLHIKGVLTLSCLKLVAVISSCMKDRTVLDTQLYVRKVSNLSLKKMGVLAD